MVDSAHLMLVILLVIYLYTSSSNLGVSNFVSDLLISKFDVSDFVSNFVSNYVSNFVSDFLISRFFLILL